VKNLKVLVKGFKKECEMCLVNTGEQPNLRYNNEYVEKFYDFLIGKKGRFLIANFEVKDFWEPIYYPQSLPK
jgi:ABC-type tungstate transport system permease subunit